MGVVYRARQVSLNRIVAVKLLQFGALARDEFKRRFRLEAESAASLQHPNIVAIHEVGEIDGQPFFSMDYVAGPDLAQRVRGQPLPSRVAACLLRTIAEAIHFAHGKGILHRDLKPSNILLDGRDQPHITDFGLAKRLTELPVSLPSQDETLTLTGQVLGTPGFMSPEQVQGRRDLTSATDIYSLGALFYFLLTGRAPFVADSVQETLRLVDEVDPISPRLLHGSVPRDLETICLKCLSKEPGRRYGSARELAEDLERFGRDEPIRARPAGRWEKGWRWCRRKPALAATAAALLMVSTMGFTGILWQWQRAEHHVVRESAQRERAQAAVAMLELQRAEGLLENDETTFGLAYLARIVRQQPTNPIAARRLLAALSQRDIPLPSAPPMHHGERIWHAEFSPDGKRVVTASGDKTARIWDRHTGAALTAPLIHPGPVVFASFSPDGARVLSSVRRRSQLSTPEYRVYLWDADSGRAMGEPILHSGWIRTAQFSSDGSQILTASEDGTAQLWDGTTGARRHGPFIHRAAVNWARFSPDGSLVVTASEDKTAHLWSTQTGQPVGLPMEHPSAVRMAEFSPNGRWVATAAKDHATRIWEVNSGNVLATSIHPLAIACMRFSPEGERLVVSTDGPLTRMVNVRDGTVIGPGFTHATGSKAAEFGPEGGRVLTASLDNTARVWDASSGMALTAPMQHDGLIWDAHFSRDGHSVVTASADRTARVWDVRRGSSSGLVVRTSSPSRVAEFCPDGEFIVSGAESGSVRFWGARDGQPLGPTATHRSQIISIKFSPDSTRVVTASADGSARVWDARTHLALSPWLRHGAVLEAADLSPDGRTLATVSASDPYIRFWDVQMGRLRGSPLRVLSGEGGGIRVIRFSPDGRTFLTDDFLRDTGQIRDAESGRLLIEFQGHEGYLLDAEFSPDGRTVASGSEDGSVRLWDARTGAALTEPMRHKAVVRDVCFNRDGRRLVSASEDGTAQVWDTATGRPVGEPLRHRGWVQQALFSPDGDLVATASYDGTARLWDAQTGRPVAEPFRHGGRVYSVRFSRDGRHLLTASASGSVTLWDIPPPARTDIRVAKAVAELAEAILGQRVDDEGALERVSHDHLVEVKKRIAELPPETDCSRWLSWILADRTTRSISPYSQVTISNHVWSLAQDTNVSSWSEALRLCPEQKYAFAQLARHHLQQSKDLDSPEAARADWASLQALRFAPLDCWSWYCRRDVVEHLGSWTNFLAEADAAIRARAENQYAWYFRGVAFLQMEQWEAATVAFSRCLALGRQYPRHETEPPVRKEILLSRATAWRMLKRMPELIVDNLDAHGLPAREPNVSSNLVDLSAFYNGGKDEEFPGRVSRLCGVDFDVRGWINLGEPLPGPPKSAPRGLIEDIPLGRLCRRLHILSTGSYLSHAGRGSDGSFEEHFDVSLGNQIGRYVVHYADDETVEIPILHGRDVRDYWNFPESRADDPGLVVAWTGSTMASRQHRAKTRLYKTTWENPRPDVMIRSVDLIHGGTRAVPILVALTIEP